MVRRLRLTNYRSFEDAEFTLEPLTVFIGPVGGGKSNVFRARDWLQQATLRKPAEMFGPYPNDFWSHRYRGVSTSSAGIGIDLSVAGLDGFPDEQADYRLEVATVESQPVIARERLTRRAADGGAADLFDRRGGDGSYDGFGTVGPSDEALLASAPQRASSMRAPAPTVEAMRFAAAVAENLRSVGYHHLEASVLRGASRDYLPGADRRVGHWGDDLPAALACLRDHPLSGDAYRHIEDGMRELVPDLDVLRLVGAGPKGLGIGFQHRGHDGYLSSDDESDGTLFTLGMLAIVNQLKPPRMLMIEEPETGLHPGRLRWLIDKLQDLAEPLDDRPPVQVLISTHSPYVLDQFHETPEAVRIVERIEGRSRVTPLVDVLNRLGIGRDDLREVSLGRRWYAKLFEEA